MTDRIRPTDALVKCPNPACRSEQPGISVTYLRSWMMREPGILGRLLGRKPYLHSVITGERILCSECDTEYCVGPAGVFRTIGQPQARASVNGEAPPPDDDLPLRPEPIERSWA